MDKSPEEIKYIAKRLADSIEHGVFAISEAETDPEILSLFAQKGFSAQTFEEAMTQHPEKKFSFRLKNFTDESGQPVSRLPNQEKSEVVIEPVSPS